MNNISKISLILFTILLISCKQQQARMPISRSSGTFMKESVIRNKKLVAGEELRIDSIIKSNPSIKYFASNKGYWYHYDIRNERDTLRPRKGDIAYFDYEIKDFKGNVIYSDVELRPQVYAVDKQNIMMGLRHGIKLMRKNEKVTFLFPSHIAYGYHGDDKSIGPNEPLICTVTLNDFKPENKLNPVNNTPKNE
ncbi:gliding motility-associated peptidyl-prolyl isomerase GldI [Flavobacterium sp.]|uniref:gliding motility-associated peptidyl-prolyl isomerase GldI n=1 Tax=Flavobacterium sp. TaxID=239 RepID=UPI0035B1A561